MKRLLFLILMFSISISLFAQTEPHAILEYADDTLEMEVYDDGGNLVDYVDIGMKLYAGWHIKTFNTVAELQLMPNGSIIKLSSDTNFEIEEFQTDNFDANEFTLFFGKLRTIAARTGLLDDHYSIMTPSAVCGVRGTDFGMEVLLNEKESAFVRSGEIEYTKTTTNETVILGENMLADALADRFEPQFLSRDQMNSVFNDLGFEKLKPSSVPGHTDTQPEPTTGSSDSGTDSGSQSEPASSSTIDTSTDDISSDTGTSSSTSSSSDNTSQSGSDTGEAASDDSSSDDTSSSDGSDSSSSSSSSGDDNYSSPAIVQPQSSDDIAASASDGSGSGEEDPVGDAFTEWLEKYIAVEAGTLVVGDNIYAKAVLEPKLDFDKFRAQFYLPLIFNGMEFYFPAGNNEWSFGSDQTGWWPILSDILVDLFLKIKYIEYGSAGIDPFFFSIGSFENKTIGHGLLMQDYSNDFDFPAIRRIGVYGGFDFKYVGLEAIVNDATNPDIFGGRFYVRPSPDSYNMAIGLSGIADIDPIEKIPEEFGTYGDPMFINMALDLDFPIVREDDYSVVAYTDFGVMLPYFREATPFLTEPGFGWDALWYDSPDSGFFDFRNWGLTAGLYGNLWMVDWYLEYRLFNGTFQPQFYNNMYDAVRGEYVRDLYDYMSNPGAEVYDNLEMGVYAAISANILDMATIDLSYLFPFDLDGWSWRDYVKVGFELLPGIIPDYDLSASVYYEREYLIPAIFGWDENGNDVEDKEFLFFDAYTTLSGELSLPVGDYVNIVGIVSTAVSYDENGNVRYNKDGSPVIGPSIGFESRINF